PPGPSTPEGVALVRSARIHLPRVGPRRCRGASGPLRIQPRGLPPLPVRLKFRLGSRSGLRLGRIELLMLIGQEPPGAVAYVMQQCLERYGQRVQLPLQPREPARVG